MVFFVRLEHLVTRDGPYASTNLAYYMSEVSGFDFAKHPTPTSDGLGLPWDYPDYTCGFKSWYDCSWWWNRGIEGLEYAEQQNFCFAVYDVPDRIDGWTQSYGLTKGLDPILQVLPTKLNQQKD